MNPYLVFILVVLLIGYFLDLIVSLLNVKALDATLPQEFEGVYDAKKYERSQLYTKTQTRFSIIQSSVSLVLTLVFILAGGFNWIDLVVRSFAFGEITTGLLYSGALLLILGLFNLPFSIYATFVIEERFGFNKTTPKTFALDLLKTVLLTIILGGPLLAAILWFFQTMGPWAWFMCWLFMIAFTLLVQFIAPVLIMPLFNKFTPLEDGTLKEAVTAYVKRENFTIQGLYTMDGSKRSSKLNAFFTGFGRFRRIVFFDTLIEKLHVDEIIAVLSHEMGHYRHHHIFKMMAASIVQSGIMFYLLSLFLGNTLLFAAFGMEHVSIYAGLIFFGFLYAPISSVLSIGFNMFSRRHEYEADRYALTSTGQVEALISSLKKLSAENLSNLTPHPLHVFLNYSHPPVLQRITALRSEAGGS